MLDEKAVQTAISALKHPSRNILCPCLRKHNCICVPPRGDRGTPPPPAAHSRIRCVQPATPSTQKSPTEGYSARWWSPVPSEYFRKRAWSVALFRGSDTQGTCMTQGRLWFMRASLNPLLDQSGPDTT